MQPQELGGEQKDFSVFTQQREHPWGAPKPSCTPLFPTKINAKQPPGDPAELIWGESGNVEHLLQEEG